MSRRLAVVVADLWADGGKSPGKNAHLIVVDQDNGKGVMLDLDTQKPRKWMPLPDIPLDLLAEQDRPTLEQAIARAHPADDPIVNMREIAAEAARIGAVGHRRLYELSGWLDNWLDRYTTPRDRTLESDLAEDRG